MVAEQRAVEAAGAATATQAWVREEIAEALRTHRRKVTIVAFSGDLDKLSAALSIATGAAASGLETSIFFTFWGLAALRDPARAAHGKPWLDRLLGRMLPAGCENLAISALDFGGAGTAFFRWRMRQRNVPCPAELLRDARDLGVRLVACQMSLNTLGLSLDELIDGVETGGVATYLHDASESTVTLFV